MGAWTERDFAARDCGRQLVPGPCAGRREQPRRSFVWVLVSASQSQGHTSLTRTRTHCSLPRLARYRLFLSLHSSSHALPLPHEKTTSPKGEKKKVERVVPFPPSPPVIPPFAPFDAEIRPRRRPGPEIRGSIGFHGEGANSDI